MKINIFKQSSTIFFQSLLVVFLSLAVSCSSDSVVDELFPEDSQTEEETIDQEEEGAEQEEETDDQSGEDQEEEGAEQEEETDDQSGEEQEEVGAEQEEETDDQSGDEETEQEEETEEGQACSDVSNFIFNENDGLVTIEFEDAVFSDDWELRSDGTNFTGEGYMVWEGNQNLNTPGIGATNFTIKIENSGTYRFIWRSAVRTGNNGTDHNDTWLRFNDADEFYADNGSSRVYPKGSGKTPNPDGATADGWFKIYRSGSDLDFKWQSSTFDNNAHDIFVVFENPGTYTMEISARSSGHGIDKFALFNENFTEQEATDDSNTSSEITCN